MNACTCMQAYVKSWENLYFGTLWRPPEQWMEAGDGLRWAGGEVGWGYLGFP